ncbi:hypothetical protein ACLI4Q_06070 [Natrialbaceae archaeon A-CW1-1]
MNDPTSGAMVIAGQGGGKSTFIGAFIAYIRDIEAVKWQGDYEMIYGQKEEFNDHIYDRVKNQYEYPEQTNRVDTYVVRAKTNTDDTYSAQRNLTMMDIPGEVQETAVDEARNRIRTGNWDEQDVRDAYENGIGNNRPIREKLNDGIGLSDKEEEKLYLYQYLSANRIVFLLNLWKFINHPQMDPVLTSDLIERVAREKRTLLLVTAADEIDYDPDTFGSGALSKIVSSFSVSSRMFDYNLYEYIQSTNKLPPNQRTSDIGALLRAAKNNDCSMFSIAVPEGNHGIAMDGASIKTQGFENIVKWLMVK